MTGTLHVIEREDAMVTSVFIPRKVAIPHSEEWYAARTTGIGASEAAAACGMSQWQTPRELYHRKRGELPEFAGSAASIRGTRFEPVILQYAEEKVGKRLKADAPPMFRHPTMNFMLATPDGEFVDDELLECKSTVLADKIAECGEEDTDEVPIDFLLQSQQQMAVLDRSVCHVVIVIPDRWKFFEFRKHRVERNNDLIDLIASAESDLWDRIQAGTPPEPDWTHNTTLGLIRALHGAPEDETDIIALEAEIVAEWEAYESLGKQIKELDDLRNVARAKVMHAVGEHAGGFLGDGRMVRRKLTERKGYTVEPTSFVDFRAVKVPKGLEVRL